MKWQDKNQDMRDQLRTLNATIPGATKGFGELSKAVKSPKTLDLKTVEFVALGIAIADRCEPCIGFHMASLVKLGATRDEISDVLGMAIQMGGGPSLMYAAKALRCYDDLTETAA
ncbi:MAG: carboxymuconolactone decarboxylase family protein [Rhodobacteraceae bacterium]|nr:carboxymuconolactone decarboxylase family protein [Paracoccaceae bacterium]